MPETSEGMALLKALDRDGVVAIDDGSPQWSAAERLHEHGLVRWAGVTSAEGRRQCVLTGRGLRVVRRQAPLALAI